MGALIHPHRKKLHPWYSMAVVWQVHDFCSNLLHLTSTQMLSCSFHAENRWEHISCRLQEGEDPSVSVPVSLHAGIFLLGGESMIWDVSHPPFGSCFLLSVWVASRGPQ